MSYGAIEAAIADDLGKEAEINERAKKLEAAVYDVDYRFGKFLAQAQDEDEFRDRISLCKKDILKVVGEHLPPVTGVMRRVISAQRAKWKKRACGEVVWGYGDSPTESVAFPDEDTTLTVKPKDDDDDRLWEWDCKGGGHSGSGVTNSPDKARQDAEDCYKFGSKKVQGRSRQDFEDWADSVGADRSDPYSREEYEGFNGKIQDWGKGYDRETGQHLGSSDDVRTELDTDITFQPEDGNLIPEDNWEGYKDSVDQNGPEKVQRNFESSLAFDIYEDFCSTNGLSRTASSSLQAYRENVNQAEFDEVVAVLRQRVADGKHRRQQDWSYDSEGFGSHTLKQPSGDTYNVYQDGVSPLPTVEHMTPGLDEGEVGDLYGDPGFDSQLQTPTGLGEGFANMDQAKDWAERQNVPQGGGKHRAQTAGMDESSLPTSWGLRELPNPMQRYVDPSEEEVRQPQKTAGGSSDEASLLDKANKALTDLLNNRAQAFQETLGPLQEALQAVMYAQQVQYQQQPMNVQSPAGTVDVMPQQQDPSGMMGQDPSMGGAPPLGGAPGALPAGLVPGDQVPGGMPVPPGEDR